MSPGTSATVQVSVAVSGGFNSAVTLSLTGLPSGWTGTYSPSRFNAPGSGSSVLTLKVPSTATAGAHNLTIAASGGGLSHTLPLTVTVQTKCKYAISPTSVLPTYTGGKFTATVTTTTGCAWTASSSFSWITVTSGASGSGSGRVNYSVASNTATTARTGALSIAGLSLAVKQSGAPQAGPSLTPPSIAFTATGGNGTVGLTMPQSTKTWIASTTAKWITLKGPFSGIGSTTLNYTVGSNVGIASRSGVISVAGLSFTVSQAGTSCSFSVNMGGLSSVSGGFNGTATVSTQASCPWSAVSNASWISVTSGASTTGSGSAAFFVTGNSTSAPRTGTLSVAGYTIQVTEAANGNIDIKAIH